MALDIGTLVGYLKIDDQKFNDGLVRGERGLKRLASSVAATVRLVSAAWLATRVVPALKDMADAASDLAETQSKVNVVLGSGAAAVTAFAETADVKLGQSKQAALDAAATFAVFGKGAGLTGNELAKFSTNLVTLSSDLASFSNTSPQEAAEALGAALRGENEPIRAYGVLLDEATIKAKALSMGLLKSSVDVNKVKAAQLAAITAQQKYNDELKKNGPNALSTQKAQLALAQASERLKTATAGVTDDMTQQQRVLAVQAAILDQTKDAQGDFARTSQGAANQQRILAAEFENVKASLGESLMPTMIVFISALRSSVEWIKENRSWLVPLIAIVGGLGGAIWLIVQAIKAWTVVQWALNIALDANPIGAVILALTLLAAGVYLIWQNSAGFRDAVIGAWGAIWGVIKAVGAWFAGPFVDFWVAAWHMITEPGKAFYRWYMSTWLSVINFVKGIPGKIAAAASGMWHGIVDSFKAAINFLIRLWNDFHLTLGGGSVLGLNIPSVTLDTPNIPYLARGGVVQPTAGGRPVMLGDGGQVEIAAPEPLMRRIVREEMTRGSGTSRIEFVISGTGILRGVRQVGRVQGGDPKTVFVGT